MKFLWKLYGNFGCHGNRTWKKLNDIFYETTEPILKIYALVGNIKMIWWSI